MRSLIQAVAIAAVSAKSNWADSDGLSTLWNAISSKDTSRIEHLVVSEPALLQARASDGRGGAWWAWEFGNVHALTVFAASGLDVFEQGKDIFEKTPKEMCNQQAGCDVERFAAEIKKGTAEAKKKLEELKKSLEEDEEDFDDDEGESVGANTLKDVLPENDLEYEEEL